MRNESMWSRSRMPACLLALALAPMAKGAVGGEDTRPNVLFAISDDQSWMHTGANGDGATRTPAFDRIASEGVRFTHAFTAAPSCTPSRGAILTGQAMWRLREGAVLHGSLPPDLPVYPRLLEAAGYFVGFTGKGWGPGDVMAAGRTERPEGQSYSKRKHARRTPGTSPVDYAANFADFLADRPDGHPFCFWYGAYEPHRGYDAGAGLRAGKARGDARLPASLPAVPVVQGDVLDYTVEIEHFDEHLGRMLAMLEAAGQLERTLVIVTSDHGMPFPRAKANLYDEGTRVPLAARWPGRIPGGRVVTDFVSLTDLAPTFLEAAGVSVPPEMTGRSLLGVLASEQSGRIDPKRDHAVIGIEQHVPGRAGFVGYPARALRTERFLYVRNFEPERWPAGDPPPFAITPGRHYADADDGPSKAFLTANAAEHAALFELAFGRRPEEELFDLARDPGQLVNVAGEERYAEELARLAARLLAHLAATGDPRVRGEAPWERYPVHAGYLAGHEAFHASREKR